MTVTADAATRSCDGGRILVGGFPRRVLRLTDQGARLGAALLSGQSVTNEVDGMLARRLVDAGLAHPAAARSLTAAPDLPEALEIVIPAYGVGRLRSSLSALGRTMPVTVVDDGSPDGRAVDAVAREHGASVLRLPSNGGPGAARNAGLAASSAALVAFVDSDALVTTDTLRRLTTMLIDPAIAVVAPRIRPLAEGPPTRRRLAEVGCPLDLGSRPAAVGPGRRLSYVPSTVLVVRRSALEEVGGFDESLRVGEDVDLCWRLVEAGWTVRYAPESRAHHVEPDSWREWTGRRHRYGTSAGPLAHRHPAAPLAPHAGPVAVIALSTAGRARTGLAVATALGLATYRPLRKAGVPAAAAGSQAVADVAASTVASARWVVQVWAPLLALAATRRGPGRRAAVAMVLIRALLAGPATGAALLADDLAYGSGVWAGCVRTRQWRPLVPRVPPRRGR